MGGCEFEIQIVKWIEHAYSSVVVCMDSIVWVVNIVYNSCSVYTGINISVKIGLYILVSIFIVQN